MQESIVRQKMKKVSHPKNKFQNEKLNLSFSDLDCLHKKPFLGSTEKYPSKFW